MNSEERRKRRIILRRLWLLVGALIVLTIVLTPIIAIGVLPKLSSQPIPGTFVAGEGQEVQIPEGKQYLEVKNAQSDLLFVTYTKQSSGKSSKVVEMRSVMNQVIKTEHCETSCKIGFDYGNTTFIVEWKIADNMLSSFITVPQGWRWAVQNLSIA